MAGWGIDFGTTNTLASYVTDADDLTDCLDKEGNPHPSVVFYSETDKPPVVGAEAKMRLASRSSGAIGHGVRSCKMDLGKDNFTYELSDGRTVAPKDVAAEIFGHIKAHAQQVIKNQPFNSAVVTIPVGMNGKARKDLRSAAQAVGIHVEQFVHEPLAALYGYLGGAEKVDF